MWNCQTMIKHSDHRDFVKFFKIFISGILAASTLPVSSLAVLPTYADHKTPLSFTFVLCAAVIGLIIATRWTIARWMFPQCPPEDPMVPHSNWRSIVITFFPLVLIISATAFFLLYWYYLQKSIFELSRQLAIPLTVSNCDNLDPVELDRKSVV